jgi:tetratricopeptide (TPR) repeat protein
MIDLIKRWSKTILLLAGITFVFILSEILFLANNPFNRIYVLFEIARLESKFENPDQALYLLSAATNIAVKHNRKAYPAIIPERYSANFALTGSGELRDAVLDHIKTADPLILERGKKYELPKILYELALLAVKYGEIDMYPVFIEPAYYTDPESSYWVVEYANYYYLQGQKDKAIEILDRCTKLNFPKRSCDDFKGYFSSNLQPFQLGFLSDSIDEIYNLIPR